MNEPSDRELQEFVTLFAGWSDIRWQLGKLTGHLNNAKRETTIPDYLNSVDSWLRDVWPKIKTDYKLAGDWISHLDQIEGNTTQSALANADARSRCLALHRALDGKLPD